MSCRGENEIYPAALGANRAQSLLQTDAPCWHWGDKSSTINSSFSSHWFAQTTSPSSHPEVLPPRWPFSVTCGPYSFIYLHIDPIHFTHRRRWHCTETETLRGLVMSYFKDKEEAEFKITKPKLKSSVRQKNSRSPQRFKSRFLSLVSVYTHSALPQSIGK